MERTIENNKVTLSGEITGNFEFSYEFYGEKFYAARLMVARQSDNKDIIPITVSDRLIDVRRDWTGQAVKVSGQFRSYNQHDGERNHLALSVFVKEFEPGEKENEEQNIEHNENKIFLNGYICKQPAYRKTPLGREIADMLLAINRPYGKSDYIPCIVWGRNARYAETLAVGTKLQLWGRVQSRKYQKKISEGEYEMHTAFEVSAWKLIVE